MKKIILVLLLSLLVISVKAEMLYDFTYPEVKEYIKTEITKYNGYNNYFVLPDASQIKYVYENGVLSSDADYQMSGLLNLFEYEVSGSKISYLYDTNNYWMMTESDLNNTCTVDKDNDLGYSYKQNNSLGGFRIAVYIKNSITITGNGSYNNPWKFGEI